MELDVPRYADMLSAMGTEQRVGRWSVRVGFYRLPL